MLPSGIFIIQISVLINCLNICLLSRSCYWWDADTKSPDEETGGQSTSLWGQWKLFIK